ncbi:TetR/AcrR family transcriptional regulator [Halolamina salifodinae]|uniref:AcrR family transcriptional regulator n=1 Tax=Halolamina salifodinae TaxID=1202767 RepID=A0A8T4GW95_9EURY|nr:TetR/AcrR family transcriptional regulator [Halolamina salifodinae]MBP1987169.1 AcrR family transcriptional regulator [Halolamina salifodinae]
MATPEEVESGGDTRREIMEATFRALSEHGYADLRVRDIGEEFEKSRTLIHYHFDGKHDLIASFLEYLIEQYEEPGDGEITDPWGALSDRLDQCLFGPEIDAFDHWERMTVYHELFAHARHDERHRAVFNDHYAQLRGNLTHVLEAGVEQGAFHDVDAESLAQLLTDVIHAARARRISLGHEDAPEQAREAVDEFVLDSLAASERER